MKEHKPEKRRKDRSDRATVDKVLDKKTLAILEKLQARGKLLNLQGSLCTGKESNVYLADASTSLCSKFIRNSHAEDEESPDVFVPVAIKIFKTSIMPFKDRERYIRSEKRFQTFCTSNPRKLIKLWAEKEVRNLKRLNNAQIPSPQPVYLKNNILIMTLIGDESAAPKLRDASVEDIDGCYRQCVDIIKGMYRKSGLIHADLSEFNLLYFNDTVHVIDVGQSVEVDHENAQRFLIMDINNINSFFSKRGVDVAKGNDLFEEITGHVIPAYLKDIDIGKDAFIPSRVSEVGNQEDFAAFVGRRESESASECSLETEESAEDVENRQNTKDERRRSKRATKEANKLRRASRISNKEKKKIFKKYIGRKKRKD